MSVAAWSLSLATLLILVTAPTVAQSPSPSPLASEASAAPSASAAPGASSAEGASTDVVLSDFEIEPAEVEVSAPGWTFAVTNEGITPHNFTIRDAAGTVTAATPTLGQGESAELVVELDAAGTYTFFCALPGHESLGMSGQLILTDLEASPMPTAS